MDKTFDEAIAGIRKAERGVEVREDIAQGMEYVKQYAEEVTDQQQAALQAAQTATGAASTATKKAAAAAESESAARTSAAEAAQSERSASADATNAESSAASAKAEADRAAAIVSTDKTLSVEGAPADAKAVGNALKSIKLPVATATTLGGVKLSDDFTADADGTLHLAGGTAPDPYPVDSIFQTVSSTSPAALFGGTWQEIAQNRVLMGASYAHAAGTTVEAGLPNITGSFVADVKKGEHKVSGAFTAGSEIATTGEYNNFSDVYKFSLDASKSNAIYGRSATVQPAAYYVHIWRRVA
jgi:membrane protein involved in colicin uptake